MTRQEVRTRCSRRTTAPLEHALKSFDGRAIHVPRATALQPDRGFLEERFAKFKRAS